MPFPPEMSPRERKFYAWLDRMRPFGWGLLIATFFHLWAAPLTGEYMGSYGFIPVFVGLLFALHGDEEERTRPFGK